MVSPDVLMVSPDVLMVSPDVLMVSPDVLNTPDVLNIPRCTEHTLYRVITPKIGQLQNSTESGFNLPLVTRFDQLLDSYYFVQFMEYTG